MALLLVQLRVLRGRLPGRLARLARLPDLQERPPVSPLEVRRLADQLAHFLQPQQQQLLAVVCEQ